MIRRKRGSASVARASSRSPEHRAHNTIFCLVTEGQGTEYDYFGQLNQTYGPGRKFLIKTLMPRMQKNGLEPCLVREHACRQAAVPEIDQVWGLFDHDGRKDKDIDQVRLGAKPERVHLALSHPSFELWLLLHFQDFPPAAQNGKSRDITSKLRGAHTAFVDYDKPSKRISQARFAALMEGDGISNAVKRARRLARCFDHETPSQRDPSTEVYLLIEALGIVPASS